MRETGVLDMTAEDFCRSAGRAAVAELVWQRADGTLGAAAVTPLVDRMPLVALPFDRTDLASALAEATAAVLVLSDIRMAWKGWTPLAARVTLRVEADRGGAWADTALLHQELVKYPPSRRLIDTPLQRREHWWYLPRWLVRVAGIERVWPVARRQGSDDGVLATVGDGRLYARTVHVDDWDADHLVLHPVASTRWENAGHAATDVADSTSALLFTHDLSIPDRDRSVAAVAVGSLRDGALAVHERRGHRDLPDPPGLLRRLTALRSLRTGCQRELAAAAPRRESLPNAAPPSYG